MDTINCPMAQKLVIFGTSNIVSDLFDCALANRLDIAKVVRHHPERLGDRDVSVADRVAALHPLGIHPAIQELDEFAPGPDELYILGPTTPSRSALAQELTTRYRLPFTTLIHPTAYVSRLATLGPGVFVGANSAIAPGAILDEHVFVNRGVTIGHDTHIGAFSRVQPGSNVGGLSKLGRGVTIGIGATLIERLVIGANAFVGAGSVVIADVGADTLVVGNPARFSKSLN
jgi:sugar O-acyltransferase (sialic acid O-acetyltransferase NeuD family)